MSGNAQGESENVVGGEERRDEESNKEGTRGIDSKEKYRRHGKEQGRPVTQKSRGR